MFIYKSSLKLMPLLKMMGVNVTSMIYKEMKAKVDFFFLSISIRYQLQRTF